MFIPDTDPNFSIPVQGQNDPDPHNPTKFFCALWSGMFIPDPDLDFLPIPDPGVKKAPGPVPQHWELERFFCLGLQTAARRRAVTPPTWGPRRSWSKPSVVPPRFLLLRGMSPTAEGNLSTRTAYWNIRNSCAMGLLTFLCVPLMLLSESSAWIVSDFSFKKTEWRIRGIQWRSSRQRKRKGWGRGRRLSRQCQQGKRMRTLLLLRYKKTFGTSK